MAKNYLTLQEREVIEKLLKEGKSFRHIGRILGRSSTTIYREISKQKGAYDCREAQRLHEEIQNKKKENLQIENQWTRFKNLEKEVRQLNEQMDIIFNWIKENHDRTND